MMRRVLLLSVAGSFAWIAAVEAGPIGIMDRLAANPDGRVSFATTVVSYNPVFLEGAPTGDWTAGTRTLGAPDYRDKHNFTSLGLGGSIVLGFGAGALTGSGSAAPDLVVSEVGPDVEDTFGWLSGNGTDWVSLGRIAGGTTAIDLDSYGFGVDSAFSFLRLMDDPKQGLRTGLTVGADIDSVAVVNSAATPVPEPGAMLLLATGLAGIVARRKWMRR